MSRFETWVSPARLRLERLINSDPKAAESFYLRLSFVTVALLWMISPSEHLVPVYGWCTPALALLVILDGRPWVPKHLPYWCLLVIVSATIVYGSIWINGPSSIFLLVFTALPVAAFWIVGTRALAPLVLILGSSLAATVWIYVALDYPAAIPHNDYSALLLILVTGINVFGLPLVAQAQLQRVSHQSQQRNLELKQTKTFLLEQQKRQDAFVAAVSHELRTPMHAILGTLETYTGQAPTPDPDSDLAYQAMRHSARHLMTVIDDLLDFSQAQSGHLRTTSRPMPLPQLLRDLAAMFRHRAEEKKLQLHVDLVEDLPEWVVGDSDRIAQVIINLLGNAMKFTDSGEVTMQAKYTADQQLVLSVKDTGRGIPEAQIGSVFERFSPLTEFTRGKYGGTGLGLSISKNIVESMGGSIGVSTQKDTGSNFWFRIPLPPLTKTDDGAAAPGDKPLSQLRARILIVDDSDINRKVARQMLLHQLPNLDISECDNGLEAVEFAQRHELDLILMDVVMPKMDGIEATRRIKSQVGSPPVIALTADVSESARVGCYAAGVESILLKPYSRDALMDAVTHALHSERLN